MSAFHCKLLYNLRVKRTARRVLAQGAACAAALAAIAAVDRALHVNPTTAALSFLVAILVISAYGGLAMAVAMSLLSTLAFNFFFLPPTGTLVVAETQNWVALAAFLVTALLASNLAERARREAAKAASAEAERQSERLRVALLDSVAHEFRTPLTAIKAAVTTLLDAGGVALADAEGRELLTIINEEADRLDRLVGAASHMAQLESSAVALHTGRVSAEEVIADALDAARLHLREHNVSIRIDPGLPALIVDRERTVQALAQVLENAGKYAPAGTDVAVGAERDPQGVRISIVDHGPGIALEEQRLIFNKFFRGTSRQGAAGSGMGLAIAKALVEAEGGRITLRSALAQGSTFCLVLPATSGGANATVAAPQGGV